MDHLLSQGQERDELFQKAVELRNQFYGHRIHLRGLIELTNHCARNCYYCGIRHDNQGVRRYFLTDGEVMQAVEFARKHHLGSVVIQSGEMQGEGFVRKIGMLVKEIVRITQGTMAVTLSCGEQTEDTYRRWYDAGASRYLLRIETANPDLYTRIHPAGYDWRYRVECLHHLKQIGYETGSGVMIGLPGQTVEDLAHDLLFLKNLDIDMGGIGPYVEHAQTPLFAYRDTLRSPKERMELTLRMIAMLRILMPDINIAATTALQAVSGEGRIAALQAGANILMPNITPKYYRDAYRLYDNKPGTDQSADDSLLAIEKMAALAGCTIAYGEKGNSRHRSNRNTINGLSNSASAATGSC